MKSYVSHGGCRVLATRDDASPSSVGEDAVVDITARTEYAVRAMLSLAQAHAAGEGPVSVDTLFHDAGFRDDATTAVDAVFHLPAVENYLDFVRSSASPILQILDGLNEGAARAAWDDIEAQLHAFDTATAWAGPNELLITAARRP